MARQKNKPRVLVVGPTLKQMGGVGMFNEILLASEGLRQDYEMLHLNTSRPENTIEKVATMAPTNFLLFFKQWLQLVKILITQRPRIMHQPITDRISFYKEGVFMLTARLFGVRVVGHLHGNAFKKLSEHRRKSVRASVRFVMGLPNVIIALSDGWRDYLLQQVSPKLKVTVVQNTVDVSFADYANHPADKSNRTTCKVLFMGSLGTRKGVPEILKALPIVRAQNPTVEFVIPGGLELGSEHDLIEQAKTEALKVGGVVFPGIVTGQAKLDLFKDADIFLLPSYNENFPIAVLEAMASQLPLIVTPVGALPEALQEGAHCFFVPMGDVQAIADHVLCLAQDKTLRETIGAANLALYHERYALQVTMNKIKAIYSQLL
ncbi:MAG: glycosyltransferase family 4 protein [Chloroflexi bacterium]|nr:glycosyltransferase family 4 protein [Chloroflexota bacterium]